MRIGLLFGQLANGGGAYQLIHLAREWQQKGHDVHLICYYSPTTQFAQEWLQGLSVHSCVQETQPIQIHEGQIKGLIRFVVHLWSMTIRLSSVAKSLQCDVLQPHEWPYHWAAVLARKSRKQRIVWMCNDVWHIPGNEESVDSRLLFRWFHLLFVVPFDKWITSKISVITVLDHRIERICRLFYKKVSIKVVRSGIDLELFKRLPSRQLARTQLHMQSKTWIWLCLSIFNPHRCFEDVIAAFETFCKQHQQALLYLVGSAVHSPQYVTKLKSLVQDKHLSDKVVFITDYLSIEQKQKYLAAADAFIFPNDQQTWGLVVIEAMATGLPCIISTGAGVHEVIHDMADGVLYPRRNVKRLIQAMELMYTNDDLREKITEQAKHHVWSTYSWQAYAEQMEHFCCS